MKSDQAILYGQILGVSGYIFLGQAMDFSFCIQILAGYGTKNLGVTIVTIAILLL